MRDEEFISEVQTWAGLTVRADAERAVVATLVVLGEQLPGDVAGPAVAALPEWLGERLWGSGSRPPSTAARAGRLSAGVARGEGSWPGDSTSADTDVDANRSAP
jgi:uncharacterized protein (DUF2267 family)